MAITDLYLFTENNLDIGMLDGSVLHIRKPSVRLMLAAFTFERDVAEAIAADDAEAASRLTVGILTRILSHNTDGIAVDEAWMLQRRVVAEIAAAVYNGFAEYLRSIVADERLRLPSKPGDDGDTDAPFLSQIGAVMAYANATFDDALDMPCDRFSAIVRQAYIDRLNDSEEGRQYIADCERLTQTEPDLAAIRSLPGYRKQG